MHEFIGPVPSLFREGAFNSNSSSNISKLQHQQLTNRSLRKLTPSANTGMLPICVK